MENTKISTLSLILIGIILTVMIWTSFSAIGENKRLKTSIKENLLEIKNLESEKKTIFESLKKDSLIIEERNDIILYLIKKEDSLINTLNHLKNERTKISANYLNADVIQRIDIFTKLATETDSIR